MLRKTDHDDAPWTVIAAESKPYARVAVLEAVIERLELGLRAAGQEPITSGAEL
jgi:polyphosphate kinase 2 (PPK2 family)